MHTMPPPSPSPCSEPVRAWWVSNGRRSPLPQSRDAPARIGALISYDADFVPMFWPSVLMQHSRIDEKYIIEQGDSTHLATVKSRGGLSFAEPRTERVLRTLAMAAASWGGKRSGGRARKIGFRPEREGRIRIIMTSVRVRLCVRREAGRRGRSSMQSCGYHLYAASRAGASGQTDRRTDRRRRQIHKALSLSPRTERR